MSAETLLLAAEPTYRIPYAMYGLH